MNDSNKHTEQVNRSQLDGYLQEGAVTALKALSVLETEQPCTISTIQDNIGLEMNQDGLRKVLHGLIILGVVEQCDKDGEPTENGRSYQLTYNN